MKQKNKKTIIHLMIATIFSLDAIATEKKILLKIPIAFNSNLPGLGTTIVYFKNRVELASNKNIKVKLYEPGKLVPPFEILDAVSTGKVNAGYSVSGYWQGKILAAPIFSSIPFGPSSGEFLAWMKFGNGEKLYQQMYTQYLYNVKVLPCGLMPPETSGWFKKEIKTISDIKGLKIRFYGLGGEVLKRLGASPSLIPGGEIFPALEKGAIDATEYSMPSIDEKLGFYKIAKYNYFPGWHQQSTFYELLINKTFWDTLKNDQKAIIEMGCNDATLYSFAQGEAMQFDSMKRMRDNHNVQIKKWPKEILDAYKKAWEEVVVDFSAKDAFFKKVYRDLAKFRENYKLWKDNAFL